jgi:hypothetical protein
MQSTLEGIHEKVGDGLGDNASPVNPDGTLRNNTPQAALMKSLTREIIATYTRVMKKAALFHSFEKTSGGNGTLSPFEAATVTC